MTAGTSEDARPDLAALHRLTTVGYHVLEGRQGPGRRATSVDVLLVGPGGAFLVDSRDLAAPTVVDGRLLSAASDVTDRIYALADLGQVVEADLAEIGVSPNEVHPVVVVASGDPLDETVDSVRVVDAGRLADVVLGHGQRWGADLVDLVVARCERLFSRSGETVAAGRGSGPETVAPDGALEVALVESMLASPVEEWMVRLAPEHAALVRRTFDGPARIHGAAGTGKTTVGLHRAAYLARLDPCGRVLVTSLTDVLPAVLERRFADLAPDAAPRVTFLTVHDLAVAVLAARGLSARTDPARAVTAFNRAWNRVGRPSVLGTSRLPVTYWQEEVGVVVRGRGITDEATYLALDRVGRAHPLGRAARISVWELHRAYADELDAEGVTDWAGLVLEAEAALRVQPYGTVPGDARVSAVIVDEAQDLSCSQVRLLHAVAGDGRDGLLLLDDGRQSIYPGGHSLDEAGVDVDGRSVELRTNFRTSAAAGVADVETVRWHGAAGAVADAVVDRVRQVVAGFGTDYGHVGVLAPTVSAVRAAGAALVRAGIPVRDLSDARHDDAAGPDAVTVGTIKRARGLEFKQVLLCGFSSDVLGTHTEASDASREVQDRARRELLVGSARARDGLWIATTPPR